jgi:hypothetical protein
MSIAGEWLGKVGLRLCTLGCHPDAIGDSLRTFSTVAAVGRPNCNQESKRKKMAKKSRLVQKNGECNIYSWNVSKRDRQFLRCERIFTN